MVWPQFRLVFRLLRAAVRLRRSFNREEYGSASRAIRLIHTLAQQLETHRGWVDETLQTTIGWSLDELSEEARRLDRERAGSDPPFIGH
jgi:hypothetical protein